MGIGRFAFTPILPAMRDAFGLSTATLGALASVNYLGYLVGALVAAALPPGRASGLALRGSVLTVIVVTALMATTAAIPLWLILRFVAGVASAGVFVFGSAAVLSQIAGEGRLDLSGWFFGGVGAGIATAGVVVLVLERLNDGPGAWRGEWLGIAALAAALAIPCLAWLPREREVVLAARPIAPAPGERRDWRLLPLVLLGGAYFLEGLGYIVAGTFLVAIVGALPGLAEFGTGAWILVGLAAAPSANLWTRVAARVSPAAALLVVYLAQALGLVLPVLSGEAWAAATSAILFGSTFIGITALTVGEARRLVPPPLATRSIASLTAVFGLGQIIGPLLAAALEERPGDFNRALVVASGAVLIGGLLAVASGLAERRHA